MTFVALAFVAFARETRAKASDGDDDDDARDMLKDFMASEARAETFALFDENTGEKIAGGMAIVSPMWKMNTLHVGVFMPNAAVPDGVNTTTVTICEFSKPENCVKEKPYPEAPGDYACGLDDESRDDTGFDCDSMEVPIEPDGDLSVDAMLEDPEASEDYDYSPAPAPAPARKLLSAARLGRANPRRSRTLRTTGARGAVRG